MSNKVILLGLNEINFDFIKYYVDKGKLPNFKSLLKQYDLINTISESEYRLLEPWIQWVTIHSGMSYSEHQIFRLGDIVDHPEIPQIFEELESEGKLVAAVSPFNAANRLNNAAFFIPDPWTKTEVTGDGFIKSISDAIQDSVNNNASGSFSIKSLFSIGIGFLKYVPISRWSHYINLFFARKKPGIKAVILDSLLSDIFFGLWKKKKPDFANLFLNSGAHIQHHYLFNSDAYIGNLKNPEWYCPKGYDPLINILEEYDITLGKLEKLGVKIILATGLHQNPHSELTYYWRLNNHVEFLKKIDIVSFESVIPRMSRDFLVNFASDEEAVKAQDLLESFKLDDQTVFDVDNRGSSIFAELIYPNDIHEEAVIVSEKFKISIENFKKYVSFVAIKNGEHNGTGYLISTGHKISNATIPLTKVKDIITAEVLN